MDAPWLSQPKPRMNFASSDIFEREVKR